MKKVWSVLLVVAVLMSLCVGFAGAASAEGDTITLNFWGWGTEWNDYYDYFLKTHPDTKIRLNIISKAWDEYQVALDTALASGGSAQDYPDLFCAESSFVQKYISSEYSMNLLNLDPNFLTTLKAAGAAEYALGVGTDASGTLKGISFQNCALGFYYRVSLAEKYLGTSDPAKVQESFKDLDTMIATAEKIHKDSNGTVALCSSIDDLSSTYYGTFEQPLVADGKIYLGPELIRYVDDMKYMVDNGMVNNTKLFDTAWTNDINDQNEIKVFGFGGAPWKFNLKIATQDVSTSGDWHVTSSIVPSFNGGTWLGVGKDADPAKYQAILEFLNFWGVDASENGLGQYLANAGDCPVLTSAIDRLSKDFSLKAAGGQNTLEVYAQNIENFPADSLAVKNFNYYTGTARDYLSTAVEAWISGETGSLQETMEYYVEQVESTIDISEQPDVAAAVAAYEAWKAAR